MLPNSNLSLSSFFKQAEQITALAIQKKKLGNNFILTGDLTCFNSSLSPLQQQKLDEILDQPHSIVDRRENELFKISIRETINIIKEIIRVRTPYIRLAKVELIGSAMRAILYADPTYFKKMVVELTEDESILITLPPALFNDVDYLLQFEGGNPQIYYQIGLYFVEEMTARIKTAKMEWLAKQVAYELFFIKKVDFFFNARHCIAQCLEGKLELNSKDLIHQTANEVVQKTIFKNFFKINKDRRFFMFSVKWLDVTCKTLLDEFPNSLLSVDLPRFELDANSQAKLSNVSKEVCQGLIDGVLLLQRINKPEYTNASTFLKIISNMCQGFEVPNSSDLPLVVDKFIETLETSSQTEFLINYFRNHHNHCDLDDFSTLANICLALQRTDHADKIPEVIKQAEKIWNPLRTQKGLISLFAKAAETSAIPKLGNMIQAVCQLAPLQPCFQFARRKDLAFPLFYFGFYEETQSRFYYLGFSYRAHALKQIGPKVATCGNTRQLFHAVFNVLTGEKNEWKQLLALVCHSPYQDIRLLWIELFNSGELEEELQLAAERLNLWQHIKNDAELWNIAPASHQRSNILECFKKKQYSEAWEKTSLFLRRDPDALFSLLDNIFEVLWNSDLFDSEIIKQFPAIFQMIPMNQQGYLWISGKLEKLIQAYRQTSRDSYSDLVFEHLEYLIPEASKDPVLVQPLVQRVCQVLQVLPLPLGFSELLQLSLPPLLPLLRLQGAYNLILILINTCFQKNINLQFYLEELKVFFSACHGQLAEGPLDGQSLERLENFLQRLPEALTKLRNIGKRNEILDILKEMQPFILQHRHISCAVKLLELLNRHPDYAEVAQQNFDREVQALLKENSWDHCLFILSQVESCASLRVNQPLIQKLAQGLFQHYLEKGQIKDAYRLLQSYLFTLQDQIALIKALENKAVSPDLIDQIWDYWLKTNELPPDEASFPLLQEGWKRLLPILKTKGSPAKLVSCLMINQLPFGDGNLALLLLQDLTLLDKACFKEKSSVGHLFELRERCETFASYQNEGWQEVDIHLMHLCMQSSTSISQTHYVACLHRWEKMTEHRRDRELGQLFQEITCYAFKQSKSLPQLLTEVKRLLPIVLSKDELKLQTASMLQPLWQTKDKNLLALLFSQFTVRPFLLAEVPSSNVVKFFENFFKATPELSANQLKGLSILMNHEAMDKHKAAKTLCAIKWIESPGYKLLQQEKNRIDSLHQWLSNLETVPFVCLDPSIQRLFAKIFISLMPNDFVELNRLLGRYYALLIKGKQPDFTGAVRQASTAYQNCVPGWTSIAPLTYCPISYDNKSIILQMKQGQGINLIKEGKALKEPPFKLGISNSQIQERKNDVPLFLSELAKFDKILLKELLHFWFNKYLQSELMPTNSVEAFILDFIFCRLNTILAVKPNSEDERMQVIELIDGFIYACVPTMHLRCIGDDLTEHEGTQEALFDCHSKLCFRVLFKALQEDVFVKRENHKILHEWILNFCKSYSTVNHVIETEFPITIAEKSKIFDEIMSRLLKPTNAAYVHIHAAKIFQSALKYLLTDNLPLLAKWLPKIEQVITEFPSVAREKQPLIVVVLDIQKALLEKERSLPAKGPSLFSTAPKIEAAKVIFDVIFRIYVILDQENAIHGNPHLLLPIEWLYEMARIVFGSYSLKYSEKLMGIVGRLEELTAFPKADEEKLVNLLSSIFMADNLIKKPEDRHNRTVFLTYVFKKFSTKPHHVCYPLIEEIYKRALAKKIYEGSPIEFRND